VVISEPLQLLEHEALGPQGESIRVEEVAAHEEGVDFLADRQLDRLREGLAGGIAEALPRGLGPPRERRIQMYVGDVHESHAAK
jgi:hypothetical protein